MSKAVIIFSFEEPEDQLELGRIMQKTKGLFYDREGIKAHMAINESAQRILRVVEPRESGLVDHAKKELARINNEEEFNNSIINAIEEFAAYGHSGGSASVAIPLLNDLLQFKNLTPLTNDPKEWNEVGTGTWQSSRNPEAFSDNKGRTYYLLSERDGLKDGESLPLHESVVV